MSCRTLVIALTLLAPGLAVAAEPAVTAVVQPRAALVAQHSLGAGYHNIVMTTEAGDTYSISGPSVVYDFLIRRTWGFMFRVEGFFPVAGSMSGPSGEFGGSLVDIYDEERIGVDALLMGARHFPLVDRLSAIAAAGVHVQAFALSGSEYSPVETATLGLGALGKLDYALSGWLSASASLELGADFVDLISHKNPATFLMPLSLSFAIGARY